MLLNVSISGYSHDGKSWPSIKICIDDMILFDGQVINDVDLSINKDLLDGTHTLTIEHYGKSFGENGVWNTTSSSDRYIEIKDIKFDHVSIREFWHAGSIKNQFNPRQLRDYANNNEDPPWQEEVKSGYDKVRLSFNGQYQIEFYTPEYDWLILNRISKHRVTGRLKDSSLTSVVNWRLDYVKNSHEIMGTLQECKDMLARIP